MRVPLIATLGANCSETRPFPALDGAGKISFSSKDGEATTFQADIVECVDFLATGKTEINFGLGEIPSKSWSIIVTDQRIVVYNKFSKGLIGKAKEKNGKASAGHMYYGSISNISTFYQNGTPVLLFCCYRKDGTRTAFTVKSSDLTLMKRLSSELHDRIDYWIVAHGRKLHESDGNKDHIDTLEKWNDFNANLWNDGKEYLVFVPSESWDLVPDSRVF